MRNIKLVNHACFSFSHKTDGYIVDPWFKGSIFNNSWRLVSEGGDAPENLKYIVISHEHPDHLHWPTLKKLASPDITIILCERNNDNVESNLKKLGYNVLSLPNQREHDLNGLRIEFIRQGHDHTVVFNDGETVMVNQNDCHLSEAMANYIKVKYPVIDIWWMQFSLAGYYGNLDDKGSLWGANKKHRDMFSSYRKTLNPRVAIPFASFVYFCRDENKALNNYRVTLQSILDENEGTQILYKGDFVLNENYKERNSLSISKWESDFDAAREIESPAASRGDLVSCFNSFCEKYKTHGLLEFELYDEDGCVLNFTEGKCSFGKVTQPVAKVALYDLSEMFKNPWGADTMNITSCFHVYDLQSWKGLLGAVDSLYRR
tara:strand:- start:2392 stop:3516 length:1125 start_codon:yes stop_codon:yes gene_type:complete